MKSITIIHNHTLYTAHISLDGSISVERTWESRPTIDPNPPPEVLDEIDRLYAQHDPEVEEDDDV